MALASNRFSLDKSKPIPNERLQDDANPHGVITAMFEINPVSVRELGKDFVDQDKILKDRFHSIRAAARKTNLISPHVSNISEPHGVMKVAAAKTRGTIRHHFLIVRTHSKSLHDQARMEHQFGDCPVGALRENHVLNEYYSKQHNLCCINALQIADHMGLQLQGEEADTITGARTVKPVVFSLDNAVSRECDFHQNRYTMESNRIRGGHLIEYDPRIGYEYFHSVTSSGETPFVRPFLLDDQNFAEVSARPVCPYHVEMPGRIPLRPGGRKEVEFSPVFTVNGVRNSPVNFHGGVELHPTSTNCACERILLDSVASFITGRNPLDAHGDKIIENEQSSYAQSLPVHTMEETDRNRMIYRATEDALNRLTRGEPFSTISASIAPRWEAGLDIFGVTTDSIVNELVKMKRSGDLGMNEQTIVRVVNSL